ncbi:ribonuclease P protein component [Algoriphagus hitonicola]|uniref:Ribonuclease P protein component n=1 Tax=Algoriphagus hitonicola TaxID=435880 RepID=A0A1I2XQT1_9BACT|nr:ribonuclease P protein component [Algoriphagus hitonicola]SFH14441.1 ribonuclease P protein component [Algoriphagus hitonicola]
MNYRFPKNERLCAQKLIKELFNEGSSFFLYPFKVLYLKKDSLECHQVLISISKKKVKKAVHRNHLKRRIKESYRLNKHSLRAEEGFALFGLIYVGSGLMEYRELDQKVKLILDKLQTKLSDKNEKNEDKK